MDENQQPPRGKAMVTLRWEMDGATSGTGSGSQFADVPHVGRYRILKRRLKGLKAKWQLNYNGTMIATGNETAGLKLEASKHLAAIMLQP